MSELLLVVAQNISADDVAEYESQLTSKSE